MSVELYLSPDSRPVKDPFNFEHFAKQPEYVQVNRELVSQIVPNLPGDFVHVDVACGTGLGPKLILEGVGKTGQKGKIIGVDPNTISLNIAREETRGSKNVFVEFIEGMGQNLETLLKGRIQEGGVDSISMLDALHEIRSDEEKVTVLKSMAKILKPKSLFVFNSAFTTAAIEKASRDWAGWKIQAMSILGRKRDKEAPTMPIHSPAKYKEMIQSTGFEIAWEAIKIVHLTKRALEAISMYPEFIKGVFEDMQDQDNFSLKEKSDALKKALEDRGVSSLPRVWYEIIAQKPSYPAILA